MCWAWLSATATPNCSSLSVKLTKLKPFLCQLMSLNCGSHLKSRCSKVNHQNPLSESFIKVHCLIKYFANDHNHTGKKKIKAKKTCELSYWCRIPLLFTHKEIYVCQTHRGDSVSSVFQPSQELSAPRCACQLSFVPGASLDRSLRDGANKENKKQTRGPDVSEVHSEPNNRAAIVQRSFTYNPVGLPC